MRLRAKWPATIAIRGGQDGGIGRGGDTVLLAQGGRDLHLAGDSVACSDVQDGAVDGDAYGDAVDAEFEDLERELEEAQDARAVAEQV
jgi:hypothetical protein